MTAKDTCPRCHIRICEERQSAPLVICNSCGHVLSNAESHIENNAERTNLRLLAALSLAAIVTLGHLGSWGSYSVEIRWLQLHDLIGTASSSSYERMIDICKELKKSACVEYAYSRQARLEPKSRMKFAEFLISRNKFKEAANALKPYVDSSTKDPVAFLSYARALGEAGQIDEATRYYEYVINGKARSLTTEAAESYVKHLARAKRYDQAQKVIYRIRRQHLKNSNFMGSELRILSELGSSASARGLASTSKPTYHKR